MDCLTEKSGLYDETASTVAINGKNRFDHPQVRIVGQKFGCDHDRKVT